MRPFLFFLLLLFGLAAILCGLIVPAHLRAVDPFVLRAMPPGKTLPALAAEEAARNTAAAKLLLLAAEELNLDGTEPALDAIREASARPRPRSVLAAIEAEQAGQARVPEVPVLAALRTAAARARLTNSFRSTEARRILQNLALTNTTLFAPARSAAGFPLEAAVLTTAFLAERKEFASALHDQILRISANGPVGELEEFYLNILALAKRFSSGQIAALAASLPSFEALDGFSRAVQFHPASTAVLYSAVVASGDGSAVARYLREHPQTAVEDLTAALALGAAPLNRLLAAGQPVFRSNVYNEFASDGRLRNIFAPMLALAVRSPAAALLVKLFLLALGAGCVVAAARFTRREEDRHYVLFGPFTLIRRSAAAAVLLLLLILLGEPYLARGGGEEPARPRITFSLAALTAPAPLPTSTTSKAMLDPHTFLAIATFLVLQGLIYTICLVKLAEIRRQPVNCAMKLKLLDNEENLFDAGLYCGLFGTAASLILLTLGIIKPSLISAYSSTLFGILFVALVKIVHVRPYKRRLILETAQLPGA